MRSCHLTNELVVFLKFYELSVLQCVPKEAFQELRGAYRKLGGVTPTKPEDLPRCDQAMAKLAREYEKFGLTPQEVALYATLYDLAKQIVETDAKILETLR